MKCVGSTGAVKGWWFRYCLCCCCAGEVRLGGQAAATVRSGRLGVGSSGAGLAGVQAGTWAGAMQIAALIQQHCVQEGSRAASSRLLTSWAKAPGGHMWQAEELAAVERKVGGGKAGVRQKGGAAPRQARPATSARTPDGSQPQHVNSRAARHGASTSCPLHTRCSWQQQEPQQRQERWH
jgi:hypothetical protein